jgi:hypothetical protein
MHPGQQRILVRSDIILHTHKLIHNFTLVPPTYHNLDTLHKIDKVLFTVCHLILRRVRRVRLHALDIISVQVVTIRHIRVPTDVLVVILGVLGKPFLAVLAHFYASVLATQCFFLDYCVLGVVVVGQQQYRIWLRKCRHCPALQPIHLC